VSDVTVSIEGLLNPTTATLPEACTLLWQTLREQPLGAVQADSYRRLLGAGHTARVEQMLDEDGQVDLTVRLPGGVLAAVRIWRGTWTTPAERIAARYLVVRQPDDWWAVRDLDTGELVRDVEDTVLTYPLRRDAEHWVRSCMYLAPGASRGQG
jgi:hypothetical protein